MNSLHFQETTKDNILRFRSFYGRNINQMPLLLSGKDKAGKVVDVPRVPMTPRQLLQERVRGGNENDQKLLRDNYIDTACAVITDSSGEVLVGLYSDPLVEELINSLNPGSRLQRGSLPVDADAYQEIKKNKAFVISRDEASNLRDSAYNGRKVREEFWDYITEGDEKLVRDHLRLVQERQGGSMENSMGLFVSTNPGLRLLGAWSVGDGIGYADGLSRLGDNDGRLVGVVSAGGAAGMKGARERAAQKKRRSVREAAQPPRPSLEEVLAFGSRYVPQVVQDEFEAGLHKLYRSK